MVTPRNQRYYMGEFEDIHSYIFGRHKRITGRMGWRPGADRVSHAPQALLRYCEGWLRDKGYIPRVLRSATNGSGFRMLKVRALIRGRMWRGKRPNRKDLREPKEG